MGATVAWLLGISAEEIELGVIGFPVCLTVMAMFLFYSPSSGVVFLASVAGIATLFSQQALLTMLNTVGLPYMSLPFCLCTLPFIIVQGTTNLAVPVPLEAISIPEDHRERVQILHEGFALLPLVLSMGEQQEEEENKQYSNNRQRKIFGSSSRELDAMSEAVSYGSFQKTAPRKGRRPHPSDKIIVDDAELEKYKEIFARICKSNVEDSPKAEARLTDFTAVLQGAGLTKPQGLTFAAAVFNHLDVDRSGSIDLNEFVRLCIVSQKVGPLRHRLARFFEFVDKDASGGIDLHEINASLSSLGEPPLSAVQRKKFMQLVGSKDQDDEVAVVDLINIITTALIRRFVARLRDEMGNSPSTS